MEENQSVFSKLNAVNCNEHVERKGNLSYLSWAWAWQLVKAFYPDASYTIYESPDGWNYFTDGKTCWVKVGVTIEGSEHIEYLPIMDARNQSIPLNAVRSTDVNKSIQRGLTKACARHGLGLYIYAGEDLPDIAAERPPQQTDPVQRYQTPAAPSPQPQQRSYYPKTSQQPAWRNSQYGNNPKQQNN